MLKAFERTETGTLAAVDPALAGQSAVWLDLFDPTASEREIVRAILGLSLPTRADMDEIEASSRLYSDAGALVMTAGVVVYAESEKPVVTPVTFILQGDRLATLRHHDPQPFRTFAIRIERQVGHPLTAPAILIGLLEAIIDRSADILEHATSHLDELTELIFAPEPAQALKKRDLREVLRRIGRVGDRVSKLRESLNGMARLLLFLTQALDEGRSSKDVKQRLKTLQRDVKSLTDQDGFVTARVSFLLDATLGLISIEQNAIIKIFSVAAAAFLPPTLIASIYGMNFQRMPELDWSWGYPMAIGLMVLSGVLPLWYFRRKGWL